MTSALAFPAASRVWEHTCDVLFHLLQTASPYWVGCSEIYPGRLFTDRGRLPADSEKPKYCSLCYTKERIFAYRY